MSASLLLPNRFKLIGWLLLIPSAIAGIFLVLSNYDAGWIRIPMFVLIGGNFMGPDEYFTVVETDITATLVGLLFIAGALMVAFSKEKQEDEFIASLRLSSLLWAVWVSYILLALAFLLVYGTAFFQIMVFNMFTVLIIFIIRFNFLLYRNAKSASDEK